MDRKDAIEVAGLILTGIGIIWGVVKTLVLKRENRQTEQDSSDGNHE